MFQRLPADTRAVAIQLFWCVFTFCRFSGGTPLQVPVLFFPDCSHSTYRIATRTSSTARSWWRFLPLRTSRTPGTGSWPWTHTPSRSSSLPPAASCRQGLPLCSCGRPAEKQVDGIENMFFPRCALEKLVVPPQAHHRVLQYRHGHIMSARVTGSLLFCITRPCRIANLTTGAPALRLHGTMVWELRLGKSVVSGPLSDQGYTVCNPPKG